MELRLKKRFIITSGIAIFIALLLVLGIVDLTMAVDVNADITNILDFISENGGVMPDFNNHSKLSNKYSVFITEESQFENRYFTVFYNSSGDISGIYLDNIAAVSESEAMEMANNAYESYKNSTSRVPTLTNYGVMINDSFSYYYRINEDSGGAFIVFLDATQKLSNVRSMVRFTLYIGLVSMLIFMFIMMGISSRMIRPWIQSQKKQKEFITNAGHELKTPIAIISANTEVIEMTQGKSEWTESTMTQVRRLSGLVDDLITLARLDESGQVTVSDVDYSAEARDVCESFESVARSSGKELKWDITDGIIVKAEKKNLHTMINILVDNAVKYADDGGSVEVLLSAKGKQSVLQVTNSYKDGKDVDVSRFFDRFYREDESHNNKKKGYGIGLSMAENIVRIFGGKINASYIDGRIMFTVTMQLSTAGAAVREDAEL